jgi:hypothetical protein
VAAEEHGSLAICTAKHKVPGRAGQQLAIVLPPGNLLNAAACIALCWDQLSGCMCTLDAGSDCTPVGCAAERRPPQAQQQQRQEVMTAAVHCGRTEQLGWAGDREQQCVALSC